MVAILPKHRKIANAVVFLCCTVSCSWSQPIIPRSAIFNGESRSNFQFSSNGQQVFFQSTTHKGLGYLDISKPNIIHTLSLPESTHFWLIVKTGVLIYYHDSISILNSSGEKNPVLLPFPVRSLRVVNQAAPYAFELTGKDSTLSGIYHLSINETSLKRIDNSHPGKKLFYDRYWNLVAAQELNPDKGNTLFYYNRRKQLLDTLVKGTFHEDLFLGGFTKVLSVSKDGRVIYYTSNETTDKSRLFAFHVLEGKKETLAKSDLVDLLPFGWSDYTTGKITSVVGLYARSIRITTSREIERVFLNLSKKLEGDISYMGRSMDGTKWFIRTLVGGPAKVYAFELKTNKLTYLLSDNPALDTFTLAKRYAFVVHTRDGLRLPIHVYLPTKEDNKGMPVKPLPALLYVHGGPWVGVTFWNSYFHCRNFQLLANRGYAVIVCEFRGTTGLGKKITEMGYRRWGTEMNHDLTDIANWAVIERIAQRDKVGIWGWSYGGYATLASLAFSSSTYKCGIAMYGISDLMSFSKSPYGNSPYWRKRIGDPATDSSLLRQQSPINYARNFQSPVLLTTGTLDERVEQSQMENMAEALKKQGKNVIYFFYPDEGHDYQKPESWISFWSIAEKFLSKHLGGLYEEMDEKDIKSRAIIKIDRDN